MINLDEEIMTIFQWLDIQKTIKEENEPLIKSKHLSYSKLKILMLKNGNRELHDEENEKRRKWLNNNGLGAAYQVKRRSTVILATPKWADKDKINEIYKLRLIKTNKENKIYHVDHIIPLKCKIVCGLHVHNNLRIVGQSANCRKSNKFKIE